MRCPKSRFPIQIIVFYELELIIFVSQGLTLSTASLVSRYLIKFAVKLNCYNDSTRLDAAQTQPGFLDVKMRTKIMSPPRDLVAVLGAEARLSCQVRHCQTVSFLLILNTLSSL